MSAQLAHMVRHVRRQVAPGKELPDASLLARWLDQADQSAFELLLWRHGPMVWATCRRVLRHEQDAEDAFQAAFLALARKAAGIRHSASLAGWLYRVAHRAALAARSRPLECRDDLDEVAAARADDPDLRRCLDEEIQRLPERYRAVVVLCYLQGLTTDEAADALGWPRGTVATRLAWARQRLRDRLDRRGVGLPAALAAPLAPAALVESCLQTVTASAAGGAIPAAVAALTEEVLTMLWMSKVKSMAVWLAPVVLTFAGIGGLCLTPAQAQKPEKKSGVQKPAKPNTDKKPGNKAEVHGLVKSVAADQKTIVVITQTKNKDADEQTTELKLTDKTEVTFSGVGLDMAKIKDGLTVSAFLVEKSKDTLARAVFFGENSGKGPQPSLTGPITALADDGKSFTVLIKKAKKNENAVEKSIKITAKTEQLFQNVLAGEAKLVKDMSATVWLAPGSEDTAAKVAFLGKADVPNKKNGGDAAAHHGVVTEVAKDGKSFTFQEASKNKGEEGNKVTLKLGADSKQVFGSVPAGKAALAAGQSVHVWVKDAKDTATVVFAQSAQPGKPGKSALGGKVTAVADGGKSFTLLLPGTKKNEAGKQVEIKLAEQARLVFENVAAGGAKITKDYMARVQLAEGSKDTAAMVVFSTGATK